MASTHFINDFATYVLREVKYIEDGSEDIEHDDPRESQPLPGSERPVSQLEQAMAELEEATHHYIPMNMNTNRINFVNVLPNFRSASLVMNGAGTMQNPMANTMMNRCTDATDPS